MAAAHEATYFRRVLAGTDKARLEAARQAVEKRRVLRFNHPSILRQTAAPPARGHHAARRVAHNKFVESLLARLGVAASRTGAAGLVESYNRSRRLNRDDHLRWSTLGPGERRLGSKGRASWRRETLPPRFVLPSYRLSRRASHRRAVLYERWRRQARFALLEPPHGFEPYLSDPQVIDSLESLVDLGERGMALGVEPGSEFWRQFFDRAAALAGESATLEPLVELLALARRNQAAHRRFLGQCAFEIMEDVARLRDLSTIAEIVQTYCALRSYAPELFEACAVRANELLERQRSRYGYPVGPSAPAPLDPVPLGVMLRSLSLMGHLQPVHREFQKQSSLTQGSAALVAQVVETLVEVPLLPSPRAICAAFGGLLELDRGLLSSSEQQRLAIRAQLLTAVVFLRPPCFPTLRSRARQTTNTFERDRQMRREEAICSAAVEAAAAAYDRPSQRPEDSHPRDEPPIPLDLAAFAQGTHEFSRAVGLQLQPEVRDILFFNLVIALKHMFDKMVAGPSPCSVLNDYFSEFPFCCPSRIASPVEGRKVKLLFSRSTSSSTQPDSNEPGATADATTAGERRGSELQAPRSRWRYLLDIAGRRKSNRLRQLPSSVDTVNLKPASSDTRRRHGSSSGRTRGGRAGLTSSSRKLRRIAPFCWKLRREHCMAGLLRKRSGSAAQNRSPTERDQIVFDNESRRFMSSSTLDGQLRPLETSPPNNEVVQALPLKTFYNRPSPSQLPSGNLAIWARHDFPRKRDFFTLLVEKALSLVLDLWRAASLAVGVEPQKLGSSAAPFLLPIRIANAPDGRLPKHRRPLVLPRDTVMADLGDKTPYARTLFFVGMQPKASHFERMIVLISVIAVLRFGPQLLPFEGICNVMEGVLYTTLQRAWTSGELELPEVFRCSMNPSEVIRCRGLRLLDDELQCVDLLCFEAAKKWATGSAECKYRMALALRVMGFENAYLNGLIKANWRTVVAAGRQLGRG